MCIQFAYIYSMDNKELNFFDIFSELRTRLYGITHDKFQALNEDEYTKIIKDIIPKFFINRNNISVDIIQGLINEISEYVIIDSHKNIQMRLNIQIIL